MLLDAGAWQELIGGGLAVSKVQDGLWKALGHWFAMRVLGLGVSRAAHIPLPKNICRQLGSASFTILFSHPTAPVQLLHCTNPLWVCVLQTLPVKHLVIT